MCVLGNDASDVSSLAESVSIDRLATVRKMRSSVYHALASPHADKLLAGLPTFAMAHLREMSQSRRRDEQQLALMSEGAEDAENPSAVRSWASATDPS